MVAHPYCIAELNMRYIRPLRSGDRFRGSCRVVKATAARLVFEQQLWLLPPRARASSSGNGNGDVAQQRQQEGGQGGEEQLVLTAEAVVVSLDSQYKPKRIDARLRQLLVTGVAPPSEGAGLVQVQELL